MKHCEALKEIDGEGFERCGEVATWMMRRCGPLCWYHKRQFEMMQIDVEYDWIGVGDTPPPKLEDE